MHNSCAGDASARVSNNLKFSKEISTEFSSFSLSLANFMQCQTAVYFH